MSAPLLNYAEIEARVGPVSAVVFGTGNFQGLAVMRGLGRCGIPVIAVAKAGGPGLKSRYATEVWNVPDTHVDPEGVINVVIQIGERLKQQGRRGVLIPTQDSTRRAALSPSRPLSGFPHLPPAGLRDHQGLLRQTGAVPAGARAGRAAADHLLRRRARPALRRPRGSGAQEFPLVFKSKKELPPSLRKKFRIILIKDRPQLERVLAEADAAGITHLIQDVIPGEDDELYTFGSYMNQAGELRAWFTGRKLRQQPPRFGVCRVGESKRVQEIVDEGVKMLRGLHYFGISQVESKYDVRDGRYKLIEVNPRAWAWVALPIGMQVNLAYAFFCDALGIDTPMQAMPDKRGVYISLFDDLYWSLKARDGRPWAHLFKGYDLVVEAYYAPDDPMPGLIQLPPAEQRLRPVGREDGAAQAACEGVACRASTT